MPFIFDQLDSFIVEPRDNDNGVDEFLGVGNKKRKLSATGAAISAVANTQKMSTGSQMAAILGSDGKISKRDKKLIKKTVKQEEKTTRVGERQEGRTARREATQQGLTDRVDARTDRTKSRQDTKKLESNNAASNKDTGSAQTGGVQAIDPGMSGATNMSSGGGGGGGLEDSGMMADKTTDMVSEDMAPEPPVKNPEETNTDSSKYKKYIIIGIIVIAAIYFIPKLLKHK